MSTWYKTKVITSRKLTPKKKVPRVGGEPFFYFFRFFLLCGCAFTLVCSPAHSSILTTVGAIKKAGHFCPADIHLPIEGKCSLFRNCC